MLDQGEDHPAGDAVVRPLDTGGGELLLDQELLDGTGGAAPRLRPVRHDVSGPDQLIELGLLVELGEFGCVRADLGAQFVGLRRQVQAVGPGVAGIGQVEHVGDRAVATE